MGVVNISDEAEFVNTVIHADKPVLVDVWAPWCGHCIRVSPEVEAVAEAYAGKAVVAKMDADEQQGLVSQYQIAVLPTLLIFKNGKEVQRMTGYRSRGDIGAALDHVL